MQTHAPTLNKSGCVRGEHECTYRYAMHVLELKIKIIFKIMHDYKYIYYNVSNQELPNKITNPNILT